MSIVFFFQAEDGIRDLVRSRGLGDVYKRQLLVKMSIESHVSSRARSNALYAPPAILMCAPSRMIYSLTYCILPLLPYNRIVRERP